MDMESRHGLHGELFTESLRRHGRARLAATGASMLPAIWPGDILEVHATAPDSVQRGEVVLFARDGRFYAHRVVGKTGTAEHPVFITRGDCHRRNDPPVAAYEILGRIPAIERRSRRLVPDLPLGPRPLLAPAPFVLLHQGPPAFQPGFSPPRHRGPQRKKLETSNWKHERGTLVFDPVFSQWTSVPLW